VLIEDLVRGDFASFFIIATVLVLAIALHEFGHALAADLQGDPTPRLAGRLTLNPLKHLDPVGTLFLVIAGFGWGKPVSFSLGNLRYKRAGAAIVALAGPAMNILLAIAGAIIAARASLGGNVSRFAINLAYINVLLAIFNLLPVPPLDGSRLLTLFMPPSKQHILFFLDKWGFLLLLVLVIFFAGALGATAGWATRLILAIFGQGATLSP
jgi:Zn-dependent protease